MKKFELFMVCQGHGMTVCNKAVTEHGDYKKIAQISPAGNIKWYIPVSSIPGPDLLRIEHTAHSMEESFKQALERDIAADRARTYFRMLDALSTSDMISFIQENQGESEETKIEKLKALYLKAV